MDKLVIARMDKLIILLVAIFIVFATVCVLDTVSAASSKTIDKNIQQKGVIFDIGSAPLKNNENVILKFKAVSFKNQELIVYQRFSGLIGGDTKTIIQKSKKNKLKITTTYLTGTPGNKEVIYVSSKYLPKKYYLKVFRPKMTEKLVSELVFDQDKKYLTSDSYIEWKASSFIDLSVKCVAWTCSTSNFIVGDYREITIERQNKNKLKITYAIPSAGPGGITISFVDTKYTPKQYYLKVLKVQESFPYLQCLDLICK